MSLVVCLWLFAAMAVQGGGFQWTNYAGSAGGLGDADGPASDARLNAPFGVAIDGDGNLYISDRLNHTVRKVTSTGVVTTLAGKAAEYGIADGTGSAARFSYPNGVAVDGSGNVFVADSGSSTIRKITPAGVVTTLAGSPNLTGSADGTGSAARFNRPFDVAVDADGNVYVADYSNKTIRKVTSTGVVTTLAGSAGMAGSSDGIGTAARFKNPAGVAVDSAGNVYVADQSDCTIRKVTSAGVVTTLAGRAGIPGGNNGAGNEATFGYPYGVAVDGSGNVYVGDTSGHTIRKITSTGMVTTLAGSQGYKGSSDGTGDVASFAFPMGIAVDAGGNVFVADRDNHTIRKVTSGGIVTTSVGAAAVNGSADGVASAAQFAGPTAVAADAAGNLYVADYDNNIIRKVTSGGVVTTLAGTAGRTGSADGTGGAARFAHPAGIAVDEDGTVYVADTGNSTIRKITTTGVVTTLAGSPAQIGSSDGAGASARFFYPGGLAVDRAGNIYVADRSNNSIRKVTRSGVVSTLAGGGGGNPGARGYADGTGSAARFDNPTALTLDEEGNLYVCDSGNYVIRKVTSSGVVSTIAGAGGGGGSRDGTGELARFNYPRGIARHASGDMYVADQSIIRKVTNSGRVITIGGKPGFFGNQSGIGIAARFNYPSGVAVDATGNVYLAGNSNPNIVLGTPGPPAPKLTLEQPAGAFLTNGTGTVNWGNVDVSRSVSREFTVYNDGTAPLSSLAITVDSASSGEFALTSTLSKTTLGPGESTTFTITFTPAAGGLRTATLHLASNDPDQPSFDVALMGTGVPALTSVTIASNNPNTTSRARVGDVITLSFTSAAAIIAPTVTIAGRTAAVTQGNGNQWVATRAVNSADSSSVVAFNISAPRDSAGNTGVPVTATTDGSAVSIDKSTQGPSMSSPSFGATTSSPMVVTFSLPEPALPGSVKLSFRVGFTTVSVLALAPAQEVAGSRSFDFPVANPTASPAVISGTAIPDGVYSVDLTYQDLAGNVGASVTANSVRIDTTPPVITPPADITVHATMPAGAAVTFAPTASGGVWSLVSSPPSGSTFPVGTTTVLVTARDFANNTSTATFTVTVTPLTVVENWRYQAFGTSANEGMAADTADWDYDGLANVLELAFGTNPASAASGGGQLEYAGTFAGGGAIAALGAPRIMSEETSGVTEYRAVFVRRADYATVGLTYSVEFSANLTDWETSLTTPAVLADGGAFQIVSVPFPAPKAGERLQFFRVRVGLPP